MIALRTLLLAATISVVAWGAYVLAKDYRQRAASEHYRRTVQGEASRAYEKHRRDQDRVDRIGRVGAPY